MDPPPVSRSTSNQSCNSRANPNPELASSDEMDEISSSAEPPDNRSFTFPNHSNPNSNSNSHQQSGGGSGMIHQSQSHSQPRQQQQFTSSATLLSTSTVSNPARKSSSSVTAAKREAAAIAASCASNSDSDNPQNQRPQGGASVQRRTSTGPKHKWTVDETDALVEGCNKHGIGNWTAILYDEELVGRFSDRIPGDLKDRFRTYFADTYHELYPNAKTHHGQTLRGKDAEGKSIFAKGKARERRPFTPAEDEAIKSGFDQHGPHWATIAKDEVFQGLRRPTDLRDRFRNAFPARYAELGYKSRPAKPKKDRSASSSAAHKPSINSFNSTGQVPTAAALAAAPGSAVLSDSDSPSTNRRAAASSTNSVSGEFGLSEASDAEHDSALRRSNSGFGQPYLNTVGRSTSYESDVDRASSSQEAAAAPRFLPPNFNQSSNSQENGSGSHQAYHLKEASGYSGYASSEPSQPPFFAPASYDGFDLNFPPQHSNHPKSASAEIESSKKPSRSTASGSTASGLRRSQSSKRANPKISNLEAMSQSQPASANGSRTNSVTSHHPLLFPNTVPPPPRPGYPHSFSADHTPVLPWQAASTSAVDFAQVMSSTSASQLLDSPRTNEMDSMALDGVLNRSAPSPSAAATAVVPSQAVSTISNQSQHISNQSQQSRSIASEAQAQPQAQGPAYLSNDFSNLGSNSPKPRSNSIHGQAWNPATGLNRIDGADFFRDRFNLESTLDPSNATPTAGGSWVWIPHGSAAPSNSVGGVIPPPPPPSGPPPSYPYSHPFAGDLHVTDELPSFVDLASMHLPDGTNNSGMTEQLLAQVRAQSAHSASESSLSIHSGHDDGMDMDIDMDLGMEMQLQSGPMQASTSSQGQAEFDPNAGMRGGENQRSSAPGSVYGVEDPSLSSVAPRRLSHPPRPSQDHQRSAYRSSAFAADDLALTLGSQTLFTPSQQQSYHRRRRSTDTLHHGNGQSTADLGLAFEGLAAPNNVLWPQGDRAADAEKDQTGDSATSMPTSLEERGCDQEFSLDGNGASTPFSDPPSADLDPSYAASLPDTMMQTDALSNSGLQQFSYDDIDLPYFLNKSPLRQPIDSHPLLSPRQVPLGFDFSSGWNNVGAGRAMSVQQESGSPDVRFLGNHPKAWSDYGALEAVDRDSVFPFGTGNPMRAQSQSSRASSSINGWDGGSEAGLSGHESTRDPSQGQLDDFYLSNSMMEQELMARSRTPKTTQNRNNESRDSSSQRSGY